MATISEESGSFPPVTQVETTTQILGGDPPYSYPNAQLKELVDRDAYLKAQIEAITGAGSINTLALDVEQVAHGFSPKDPVYHNGANWVKSNAASFSTAVAIGIVTTVPSSDTFTISVGRCVGLSGLVGGSTYFIQNGGGIGTTPGTIYAPVFQATSATTGWFVGNFKTLDADLAAIAALTPSDNDFLQRKSGAWVSRTPAQITQDIAGYRLLNIRTLTTGVAASYVPTVVPRAAYLEITGGGGGGGGCSHNGTVGQLAMGASGGPANTIGYWLTNMNQTFTYTIGAGGIGGVGNADGTVGGNTTFVGSVLGTLTAEGGANGQGSANSATGVVSTPTPPTPPTDGNVFNYSGGRGGIGRWLNGSFISYPVTTPGYYGGGQSTGTSGNGSNALCYGGGGSGALQTLIASVTRTGGSGGPGVIVIYEYA